MKKKVVSSKNMSKIKGEKYTYPVRNGKTSKAMYIQTNAEAAERRKRINPRAVLADPEIFLDEQEGNT